MHVLAEAKRFSHFLSLTVALTYIGQERKANIGFIEPHFDSLQ